MKHGASMKSCKKALTVFALTLTCAAGASAATLDVAADGTLMGAYGVTVAGISYDVVFRDGVVKDNVSVMHNFPIAGQASAALFSQVLLGDYDTLAKPTNGCTDVTRCSIWTPVSADGAFTQTINFAGSGDNTTTYSAATYANTDTAIYANVTLAIWSAAAAPPVPENTSSAMLLAGLGFLALAARRQRA
jgi:hypothetical protein